MRDLILKRYTEEQRRHCMSASSSPCMHTHMTCEGVCVCVYPHAVPVTPCCHNSPVHTGIFDEVISRNNKLTDLNIFLLYMPPACQYRTQLICRVFLFGKLQSDCNWLIDLFDSFICCQLYARKFTKSWEMLSLEGIGIGLVVLYIKNCGKGVGIFNLTL